MWIKKFCKFTAWVVVGVLGLGAFALADTGMDLWLANARRIAGIRLVGNIGENAGAAPGAVVASPSRSEPDYFYHWVRDASLVMWQVLDLYDSETDPLQRAEYKRTLKEFVKFSKLNQETDNLSGGPGEPKFGADGSAFELSWGRPQNDGPALRARVLTRFANLLMSEGEGDWVQSNLFSRTGTSLPVISVDLQYVAQRWREPSFDVWEEVYGQHFFHRVVSRRALIEGVELARRFQDTFAETTYAAQITAVEAALEEHWDSDRGIIVASRGQAQPRESGIDAVVIIGAMIGFDDRDWAGVWHDRVLSTVLNTERAFIGRYVVATVIPGGTPIGRYPEDTYNGRRTDRKGNPWFLTTAAMAEIHYRFAERWLREGRIEISPVNIAFFTDLLRGAGSGVNLQVDTVIAEDQPLFGEIIHAMGNKADGFLSRLRSHGGEDGSLSEQYHRRHGIMRGAEHLTWSYQSLLSAAQCRDLFKLRQTAKTGGQLP